MLAACYLGRMQSAIEVNDGFTLAGERPRVFVFESAPERQAARDVLVSIDLREILRRGNQGDLPVEAPCGSTYRDQLDSIGARGQLAEVLARFIITSQIEVVARLVTQDGFRRGNGLCAGRARPQENCEASQNRSREDGPFVHSRIVTRRTFYVKVVFSF